MPSPARPLEAISLRTCRGASGCPRAVGDVAGAGEDLGGRLDSVEADDVARRRAGGEIKAHDQLRVAVSGCPNACSQPQIADFGLIAASAPRLEEAACVACGDCVEVCREGALELHGDSLVLLSERCLACGECIKACASGALSVGRVGWRVMVGGRLGRHPRLAEELDGYQPLEHAADLLAGIVDLWGREGRPHERIGATLERVTQAEGLSVGRVLQGGES